MHKLEGRVAAITGAAGGFGRALAWALAREGMALALSDIDEPGLTELVAALRAQGHRAICVKTDVTDGRAVEALLARTLSELGACHLVCNNAGVFTAAPLLETSEAQWRRVIDTNLWGVIHGCRVFGQHFAAQREGHILNTASAAGLFPVPGMSAYSTSKFAVVGLSQQLRYELAHVGVGVTVLCPGVLKTRMAHAAGVGLEHLDLEEMVKNAASPEGLAKKAVRAVRQNRAIVLYGGEAGVFRLLRLMPSWVLDPFGRFAAKKGLEVVRPTGQGKKPT
jgi:NAD(P)-dependent dehydrogenase (short-subunit alcohol dehydrogenase family)